MSGRLYYALHCWRFKNIKNISSVIVSRVFISIALHFLHSSQPRNVIRALLFKLVKICITYFVAALTTGLYFLFSDLKPIEVANITWSPGRETPTPEGSNPINIVRVTWRRSQWMFVLDTMVTTQISKLPRPPRNGRVGCSCWFYVDVGVDVGVDVDFDAGV